MKLTEQPAKTDRQKAAKEIKKQPFPPSSVRLKDVSATNGILQTTHLKDLMGTASNRQIRPSENQSGRHTPFPLHCNRQTA